MNAVGFKILIRHQCRLPGYVRKRHIHSHIIPHGDAPQNLQSFMSCVFHVYMSQICTQVNPSVYRTDLTHKPSAYLHLYGHYAVLTLFTRCSAFKPYTCKTYSFRYFHTRRQIVTHVSIQDPQYQITFRPDTAIDHTRVAHAHILLHCHQRRMIPCERKFN